MRDAFLAAGYDAVSCDVVPTDSPGPHLQCDVREVLRDGWDMMIAHPPCSYLSSYSWAFNSEWRYLDTWWHNLGQALALWRELREAPIPLIAIENPVQPNPPARTVMGSPTQRTDFALYGDRVRKKVGLWLYGLPPLVETLQQIPEGTPSLVRDNPSWALHKCTGDVRTCPDAARLPQPCQHGLDPHTGSHARSRFQPGIARAMAEQWGPLAG